MKYILFECNGVPAPIVFPDHVPHKSVTLNLPEMHGINQRNLLSAGFVERRNGKYVTVGQSESLGVAAKPGDALCVQALLGEFSEKFEVVPKMEGVNR